MVSAIDVAKHLVWLATNDCEPDALTPLRVQKLLYYVQGWSWGMRGEPMFGEAVQAWKLGPVVKEVYDAFAQYGKEALPATIGIDGSGFDADDSAFIRSIWEGHKRLSAVALKEQTHKERPWIEAYRPDCEGRCSAVINPETMRRFFEDEYRRTQITGLELDKIRNSMRSAGGARFSIEEAFAT